MNAQPRPQGREAIKAWHRQKIIDATLEVITAHGIAGTTIARVVARADVSMGLVNVHFKTKKMLLGEVLSQLAEDYTRHWRQALEAADPDPVARLRALIRSDLDAEVLNPVTLGVWFAFRAQARVEPDYIDLVGSREREQMACTRSLVEQINALDGRHHDAGLVAMAIGAMLDGFWTDYFLYPDDFDAGRALRSVLLYLENLYPGRFTPVA